MEQKSRKTHSLQKDTGQEWSEHMAKHSKTLGVKSLNTMNHSSVVTRDKPHSRNSARTSMCYGEKDTVHQKPPAKGSALHRIFLDKGTFYFSHLKVTLERKKTFFILLEDLLTCHPVSSACQVQDISLSVVEN